LTKTLAPGSIALFFALAALIAAAFRKFDLSREEATTTGPTCLLLAFVPALIFYEVGTLTSVQLFLSRYRLVAVPGIALCWGLLLSRINSRVLRALFCVALVVTVTRAQLDVPLHGTSWKPAVDFVNANTAKDHATVLVCSSLVEADYQPIPADINSTALYATLTYYKLNSPLVLLPRSLVNPETEAQIQKFLLDAVPARRRFVAVGLTYSMPVLHRIEDLTKENYTSKSLGVFDNVAVFEFNPR